MVEEVYWRTVGVSAEVRATGEDQSYVVDLEEE